MQVTVGHYAGHCGPLCRSLWATMQVTVGHYAGHCEPLCRSLWATMQVIVGHKLIWVTVRGLVDHYLML